MGRVMGRVGNGNGKSDGADILNLKGPAVTEVSLCFGKNCSNI